MVSFHSISQYFIEAIAQCEYTGQVKKLNTRLIWSALSETKRVKYESEYHNKGVIPWDSIQMRR